MKIAHILVTSVFALFLIYAVHAYLSFELNLQEITEAISLRNDAQSNNIIQDLDKFIAERIDGFETISKHKDIYDALVVANTDFTKARNLDTTSGENGVLDSKNITESTVSKNLQELVDFYRETYDLNVIEELLVTNRYGINIAAAAANSDYQQDNESWWQITRDKGIYIGNLEQGSQHGGYSIPLAFRISSEAGDFLGVMRVVVSVAGLLHELQEDAEILHAGNKNVILLDNVGKVIYANGVDYEPSKPVSYFDKITGDNGHFEIEDGDLKSTLVSYSRSIGYGDFEGFGWVVAIEQKKSVVLTEFLEQRNSVLLVSILGMIAAIVIGTLVSVSVSRPLQQLSYMAQQISKGDFSVRLQRSKIDEVGIIDESFNEMVSSLKKLVETEKELAETRIKVKNERLSAIGQLAASMAHDLKNPLATLKSSAEIIKRSIKSDNKDLIAVLARMDRAVDRMSHQIEDVLNFVRTTSLELGDVSILSVLKSAIKSIEVPSNVTIDMPKKDFTLRADYRKLEVVFINLLLNAIQAIGASPGKITIRTKDEDGDLRIEVEDTGLGIPSEIFAKIFEPLVTTKERGTGLGLSTCKSIIEQHGGTITAKNNPTTFIVRFPKNVAKENNTAS